MDTVLIRYTVQLADPDRHRLSADCLVAGPAPGQRFRLPSWIPGSYLMREYARLVVAAEASNAAGAVAVEKLDKSTWACANDTRDVVFRIEVHALDQSVRGAFFDRRRAFFNGTCVFVEPEGRAADAMEVVVERPRHAACADWRVATAMEPVTVDEHGFGTYRAADYDELIDHPFEIGPFASVAFDVRGVRHRFALAGRADTDLERVAVDLTQLCAEHIGLFGGAAPFASYTFLALAVGEGYGGLEHRASSALIFERDDLPKPGEVGMPAAYQRFLALVSHEYFHAWHVKRTKPAAFVPYRLDRRAYTRQLWIFEGITSYYQDLLVLRSQLVGVKDYLRRLGEVLTRVYRVPGRFRQSIADASFDAWDKLYKPEADSVNSTISYYSKGALVALALDLELRLEGRSLDEILLTLWQRYGAAGVGVPEDAFEALVVETGGARFADFFDRNIRTTDDPALADLLARFGVRMTLRPELAGTDPGGTPPAAGPPPLSLGATFRPRGEGLELVTVLEGGAAQKAGLSPGDTVVALGGLKVGERTLAKRLERYETGERVAVVAFRGDELLELTLLLEEPVSNTCYLELDETARSDAVERRGAWLGA